MQNELKDFAKRSAKLSASQDLLDSLLEGGAEGDDSVLKSDLSEEEFSKYRLANPKAGFLCTFDRSWKNPKCCMGIWPYEQGLKILMCFMMCEFPYTIYECVKLVDEWRYFDADKEWHIYVFITCLTMKLLIEMAYIFFFVKFF